MAIQWGAWEPGSLPKLRVGIEVTWSSVTNSSSSVTATIRYYTGSDGDWWDEQHMTLSGKVTGGFDFTNHQVDGDVVQRAIRTWTYTYGSSSYGTSPGTATFGAAVSGAFNGATPSKSVTVNIPARPYAAPDAPTNVSSTYIDDSSIRTSWTNNNTAGRPWDRVRVQVDGPLANDVWNGDVGTAGGGATTFTDSTTPIANTTFRYRARSENDVGVSAWVEGQLVYTSPSAPSNVSAIPASASSITVQWTNTVGYSAYETVVDRYVDGGATVTTVAVLSSGTTSYTDTGLAAGHTYEYQLRARTTSGATIYGPAAWSPSFYLGAVYTPPNAPTSLTPANVTIDPTVSRTFAWTHNPTDGTAQTAYEVQWRVQGGTFTTTGKVTSGTSARTYAANTFPAGATIEWQARTWGASSTASPWSSLATFATQASSSGGTAPPAQYRPVMMDITSGDLVAAPVSAALPAGVMMPYAGPVAPTGWLICNGAEVAQADYPDLYAVLGTTWGTASTGYFKLPDMRNRAAVGAGGAYGVGVTGGSATVNLDSDNLPSHTHSSGTYATTTTGAHTHHVSGVTNTTGGHTHSVQQSNAAGNYGGRWARGTTNLYSTGDNGMSSAGSHEHNLDGTAESAGSHEHTVVGISGATGNGDPVNVQNPFAAMHYIIKA